MSKKERSESERVRTRGGQDKDRCRNDSIEDGSEWKPTQRKMKSGGM